MDQSSIEILEERLRQAEESLRQYRAIQDARERYSARGLQVTIRELSKTNAALEKAEKRLQEQNRRLEQLDNLKDRFLAIASHDLRAPLNAIKGLSDLLRMALADRGLDDDLIVLDRLEGAADFSLSLVKNLLDHTLIQTGAFHLNRETADLNSVAERVVELNRVRANQKKITLCLTCDPDLACFSFDAIRLEQVLHNLISNALKFSESDTRVDVMTQNNGKSCCLSVLDEGLGIPEDELGRIFDPYQNTSTRPVGLERSTGLGLSIVREIVRAHGGEVTVKSKVGVGSQFSVLLPISNGPRRYGNPTAKSPYLEG